MPSVETAHAFREMIEQHFFDARGLLIYNLNRRTLRPFTDAELAGCSVPHTDETPAGRWTYEDTMFCSGLYFWALAEEYRVTLNAIEKHLVRALVHLRCRVMPA